MNPTTLLFQRRCVVVMWSFVAVLFVNVVSGSRRNLFASTPTATTTTTTTVKPALFAVWQPYRKVSQLSSRQAASSSSKRLQDRQQLINDVGRLMKKDMVQKSPLLLLWGTPTREDSMDAYETTTTSTSNSSPIDSAISLFRSDIASIVLGCVGLVILIVGRSILDSNDSYLETTTDISGGGGLQTRVNLLAVMSMGAVILNGLSQLDIQSVVAESVILDGTNVPQPIVVDNNNNDSSSNGENKNHRHLQWTLSALLRCTTSASTAIVLVRRLDGWDVIAYMGMVHPNLLLLTDAAQQQQSNIVKQPLLRQQSCPILNRFWNDNIESSTVFESSAQQPQQPERRSESYLPTLQALPGKVEFTTSLVPVNTQAILLVPLLLTTTVSGSDKQQQEQQQRAVLVLGSNRARSFTPRDIVWAQTLCSRLETV